jgi:ABC-type Fe3+-hydroxamate transport system substrate-binding protein
MAVHSLPCSREFSFYMPSFTDQLGRTLFLQQPPARIVSLVPSQTELLHTLGLEKEVAGITKFCIHPANWFLSKTRIGGTKDIRPDRIRALQPDLILANKEENDKEQVEELSRHYPVWISDIHTLPDALQMILSVGELTGKDSEARLLSEEISRRFDMLRPPDSARPAGVPPHKALRTAYFIWRKPWMVAGGDTFIHDMLDRCGFHNLFANRDRYPSIELASLAPENCECILLSSEPYPFRERHIAEIQAEIPHARIRLVDGEMFSWYGSRLLLAPDYFQQLQRNT